MALSSPVRGVFWAALAPSFGSAPEGARKSNSPDWILLFSTFALCACGVASIFSATHLDARTGLPTSAFVAKQCINIALGLPVLALAWRIDYRAILRRQGLIYTLNLLLLVAVLLPGHHEVKGAQRWISLGPLQLQPSEIAKIAMIICLAGYFSARQDSIRRPRVILGSLFYAAVPIAVIFKQPDLGTAMVIGAIWTAMAFVAGARLRHLLAILLMISMAFAGLWVSGGIKTYQKDRLRVFLSRQSDPQGVGYHITQALNAIGSGKVWGKGFLHGDQGQLGYIPERHTDFIFTVVGEETGFVGGCVILTLYALFLWRVSSIGLGTLDPAARLLSAGVLSMFLYHIAVNMGMTVGAMPVTGVPLPFMSYGGSSILANLCAVGILHSIRTRQPRLAL